MLLSTNGAKITTLRRPKASRGRRAPFVCCVSKVHFVGGGAPPLAGEGLIQIVADFDSPSAYPAPGWRVTTTL